MPLTLAKSWPSKSWPSKFAGAALLALSLAGCASGGLALSTQRTQGYVMSQDQLMQIRPGQSQKTVELVMGSPQVQNTFGEETAYYYVSSRVDRTAFGLETVRERTVLAVYFDKNKRVADKAVYGLQDGRAVTIETRRTASYGEDRGFIESILGSLL
jgi:outer membrane protein assembly factor BamE (lipoprotein component of BamABCDE complex)